MNDNKTRCQWCVSHELDRAYHDTEWGVPVYDDRLLFEMLNLEGAQAGLSWLTILKKRPHYQKVFDNFEAHKIVDYDEAKIAALLADPGIVRNKLKVRGTVQNARCFLAVQEEFGSFKDYIWQFVEGQPIINRWKTMEQVPVSTPQSDAMSKDLKKRGFKFIGTTICYAYMQGVGMVNDHTIDCFRWKPLSRE
ncbi:MAG: DNA-3-methyladenine glycosylase I [Bacteroidota bacterium]